MKRSVPDTSVIISAFLSEDSLPAAALRILNRSTTMLASLETLAELREVLQRDKIAKRLSPQTRERLFLQFQQQVRIVHIEEEVATCIDPKDDKFLALAVNGDAELILSSDRHLLDLRVFRGIEILSPTNFLARPPR